ncbi:MAG: serine/threonine-protein kinase [Myxococcota bacterium]
MSSSLQEDRATAETVDLIACPECGRRNPPDARFCGGCGAMTGGSGEVRENIADPLVGQIVADRYRIVELLGRGGMGVVYKVEHVHIGKLMAMKLLHGELARNRTTVQRFQREAEAASKLSHANTVQVFDFGRSDGMMYLVMEFLDGEDLGDLIRAKGSLTFERAARIAAQVCHSLAEAHELGIVHRDIKPENIMILPKSDGGDVAKVLDFGLAKLRDHAGQMTVTNAGSIVGTPYYMPPEQIRGESVDARGDIYALGAVLYKACTGVPPFVAKTPMGVLTKHLTEELTMPSARSSEHLPEAVDRIIAKAMAKEAEDRFQSADELRTALLDFLSGAGISFGDVTMGRVSQRPTASPPDRATRAEIENYERRLRRKGVAFRAMLALLLVGLVALGAYGYTQFSVGEASMALSEEAEPNNAPAQANALTEDTALRALVGQRESLSIGDIDLYRLRIERPGFIDVRVTGIFNINLMVELYRGGQTQPLMVADSTSVGGAERIPFFPVDAGEYLLRIHERWISGTPPVENISDHYEVVWNLRDTETGWEEELNDSPSSANALALDVPVQGRIGWSNDRDSYCLTGTEGEVDVSVTGVDGVDLILRPMYLTRGSSSRVDEGAIGDGERRRVEGADLCVEVSAKRREGEPASAPNMPYTLTVTAAEEASEEASE